MYFCIEKPHKLCGTLMFVVQTKNVVTATITSKLECNDIDDNDVM